MPEGQAWDKGARAPLDFGSIRGAKHFPSKGPLSLCAPLPQIFGPSAGPTWEEIPSTAGKGFYLEVKVASLPHLPNTMLVFMECLRGYIWNF